MNVKQAVANATVKLSESSDSASLDARLITCYVCGIEQSILISQPDIELSPIQEQAYRDSLLRRVSGEPLAYITGQKEFWSLDFFVNKDVLIPRPETELLVELTLEYISKIESARILDLGTGSGAIAISIATECKKCVVTASDISERALSVAKKNALSHNTKINLIQSDWLKNLPKKKFDVIVSNPPYIAENDTQLEAEVKKNEPELALISDEAGLKDIRTIISGAAQYLSNKGCLLIEHGFRQKNEVQTLFKNSNFKQVNTYKDLSGNNRVTCGLINS